MELNLTIGIIVIGYNRVGSIKRLLNRLNACDYPHDRVPLVVSLDNCGKPNVFEYAASFAWRHGPCEVLLQPERLGLRNHILKCGSYMEQYGWDAAVVLEDDVFPAAAFYSYTLQAVAKYRDDDRIAGISLYSMPQNQTAQLPFTPLYSPYDAYFMQLAQSWGQVWMKRQWQAFSDWYEAHSEPFDTCPGVPLNVCRWPKSSWLKYHIRYCIEENKYFVYPYHALTTCFSDAGEHTNARTNVLQTPLQLGAKLQYLFPELDDAPVIYDAWHENLRLAEALGLDPAELCTDVYGQKRNYEKKRYWLSVSSAPYQVLRSFTLTLCPMDMNVLCGMEGRQLFLYDTAVPAEAPSVPDRDLQIWNYYNRFIYPNEMIRKLAKPLEKRIRKERRKRMLHPIKLFKSLLGRRRSK